MNMFQLLKHNKLAHVARIFAAVCLVGIFSWWMTVASISSYSPERDRADIIRIFNEDRYLLTSTPSYSVEHMLDTKSSDATLWNRGNLQIYTLRKQGSLIGFTAFYFMRPDLGRILFVSVDKNFRNSGYGAQLTQFAKKQLLNQGARRIVLTTRVSNFSAQRTYEKNGFRQTARDAEFVNYQYDA